MVKKAKRQKLARKICRKIFFACFLFSLGICVGIHRRVIKALITGGELPEMPEGHIPCPWYDKLKERA